MAEADKLSPRFRRAPNHLLPPGLRVQRRPLVWGDGVWVYCDHQKPNFWPSHTHGLVQIMIGFEGADYQASWAGAKGRRVNEQIKADQIWILPAAMEQEVRWRQTADLIVLYAEPATIRSFCGQLPVTPSIRPIRDYTQREPAIGMLCDDLRRQAQQIKFDHEGHIGAVGALLASFVIRSHFLPHHAPASPAPMRAADRARVERYIAEHLSEPFSLPILAKVARMSRSHFCRKFKAETGFKPREYYNRCRILRAKEMLATGRYNFTEVAYQLGFSELGHFTRVFKKVLHAPPRSFLPRVKKHSRQTE